MTVTEILAWVKRYVSTSESDANLIIDLGVVQNEIIVELAPYKLGWKYFDIYSTNTVADTLNYSLPADCKPENIITVLVSATIDATDDAEWDEFTYAGINDDTTYGNYWGKGSEEGKIALTVDDKTIQTNGLTIKIFYYPSATEISAGITPDLLKVLHNLYLYGLAKWTASPGGNPDVETRNNYQAEYDEYMKKAKSYLSMLNTTNPEHEPVPDEWW